MSSQSYPPVNTQPKDSAPLVKSSEERVWDPLIRIFHWSLVGFFLVAIISKEGPEQIHIYAGYAISILLLFRIIWGVIGTRYARFSNFSYSSTERKNYLKGLLRGHPKHYQGHNPAGGLMVFILLAALLAQCFLGVALIATEGEGPLAGTFIASLSEDLLEEVHEFIGNGLILLVVIHIAGVIVSSLLHKENLVRAMITGRKPKAASHSHTEH